MKPILDIKSISKKFRISHQRDPYLSLRDSLSHLFAPTSSTEEFWALKDVSFTVEPGDTVGIVGKNGAGKSTLLKILSKITPPTSGSITCRGRIASLLEVGTGFHPELSGRENVFLNGSILGMKKTEILKNFDAIVDFAGVERFIDTPLKHYSSGMQLRLAFAVAAFLENEILVIDEVLAVGDAEFQKKCMGKMDDVSKSGRTVLFVSHNMSAIESLCKKTVFLEKGMLMLYDKTEVAVSAYLDKAAGRDTDAIGIYEFPAAEKPHMTRLEFLCDGKHAEALHMGCCFEIIMNFTSGDALEFPLLGLIIYDHYGAPLVCVSNKNYLGNLAAKPVKKGVLKLKIPNLPLIAGHYSMDVYFSNLFSDLDVKRNVVQFRIEPKHFAEAGEMIMEKYNKFFIKDMEWGLEVEQYA